MSDVLLSVIVPVYNVEEYIDECIESICNQTYKNLEIILVDDGSTDNSGRRCDFWAEQDNRIKVIHKENGGISSARNAALEIINGDYVAFVDSDDLIVPTMYQEMMEKVSDDKSIIVCDYTKIDEQGNEISKLNSNMEERVYSNQDFISQYSNARIRTTVVVVWNKIYPKSIFDEIRYSEGMIHEDEEIVHRIVLKVEKIIFVSKELYKYRIRAGSIMRSLNSNDGIYRFVSLKNRLYDCFDAGFSPDNLSSVAYYCVEQGISCWLSCNNKSRTCNYGTRDVRKEVLAIIKEKEKYGLRKLETKWICFMSVPNIMKFLYKVKKVICK